MNINERVKEIRKELGYSQKDFSEQLRLKQSYLSEVESGKRPVGTRILAQLIDIHNVSIDFLLTGKGEKFIGPIIKGPGGFLKMSDINNSLKSELEEGGQNEGG